MFWVGVGGVSFPVCGGDCCSSGEKRGYVSERKKNVLKAFYDIPELLLIHKFRASRTRRSLLLTVA